jgi:phosphoglycolate phosphatase-like HAD superfamily hydrolase
MASKLLCLFDIDGTLVHVAEEVAFAQAFREQCGPSVDLSFTPGIVVSDTAYIHDVLTRALGRPAAAAEIAALVDRFVHLLDGFALSGDAPVRPVAGAASFLASLKPRAALAVSTGCVEPSARMKLRHAGFDAVFRCGGFSSGEASRAEIVRRAIGAAEHCYATRFDRVVLFGDGPWDLTSAREAEIEFIGINEHPRGRDRLRDAGAQHVFPDFAAVDAILRVLRLSV